MRKVQYGKFRPQLLIRLSDEIPIFLRIPDQLWYDVLRTRSCATGHETQNSFERSM